MLRYKRPWYLIVEAHWRNGWVWWGAVQDVLCTFVSNLIESQLISQFSINFENDFCKCHVSSLYLLLSHINVNEKYDLSMTNYENNFCKWYVSSLYLLLSHINVNEKYDLSMTNFENGFGKWYVSPLYLLLSHINVNEKYDLSSQLPTR